MLSPPPAPSLGSAITNRAYACHARHHAPQPPIPSCCLLAGASDQREAPWHAVAVSDKGLSRSQPASGRSHSIITYFCPVGLAQTSVLTPKTPHRTQCAIVRGLSCQLWLSCVPCLRLPLSYPSWARRGYGCWRRGCKLMAGGKSWRQLTAMTSACRTDTHTLCRGVERCRTAFLVGCCYARRACHVASGWLVTVVSMWWVLFITPGCRATLLRTSTLSTPMRRCGYVELRLYCAQRGIVALVAHASWGSRGCGCMPDGVEQGGAVHQPS